MKWKAKDLVKENTHVMLETKIRISKLMNIYISETENEMSFRIYKELNECVLELEAMININERK